MIKKQQKKGKLFAFSTLIKCDWWVSNLQKNFQWENLLNKHLNYVKRSKKELEKQTDRLSYMVCAIYIPDI